MTSGKDRNRSFGTKRLWPKPTDNRPQDDCLMSGSDAGFLSGVAA
jgi:hypothetical protein